MAIKAQEKTISNKLRQLFSNHVNEIGLVVLIILLYITFAQTTRGFLSPYNQQNILRDVAALGITAFGTTLIIVAGEIDVSIGPMIAFISVCLAYLLRLAIPLPLAFLMVFILGMFCGSIAGFLRGYFKVPSFVATLGLWSALRGLALFFTNALPVSFPRNRFLDFLDGTLMGLPVAAWIMLILFLVFSFISRKTTYGRSVYAVGGNAKAAHLSGINIKHIHVILFATAGLLATISAILLTAHLGSGNAGTANGLEFDVIAGVVIGGAALSGGRGTMLGTVLGVYVITVIGNGLVLLGINPFFQEVIRGVIIVLAVLVNIAVTHKAQKNQE